MRKFLISAAIAVSTVIAAAPAAAQYYPQGNAYGYDNHGQTRRLQVRIDQLQRQISQLDQRNILSEREANKLRSESRQLEQRLRNAGRNGLNGREGYNIERGIQRIEVRIQREARDGNRYNNRAGWTDRDRDGRNDRYEDDRGYNHD